MARVIRIPSGGSPGHVRAGEDIAHSRVFKWSNVEDEVTLCGSGEPADGICLEAVLESEVLNDEGKCQWRATTGVFDGVDIASNHTAGGEWMAGANGVITAYVVAGTNVPLGKFRTTGLADETGKITFYAQ